MAETIGTAYVQIEPSFDGVVPKIDAEFGGEGEKAGHSFSNGFASVVGTSAKIIGAGIAAAGSAVAGLVEQSVEGFGEYEQLVGGVETLFGNSYNSVEEYAAGVGISLDEASATWEDYQARQQTVLDNAANAYKTAGMNTNDYMSTVTSFAAALNSSLGENAWQSANYADQAITDMADNANKMGTSMEAVQNAYMGFSKGNFTMLDNLKLGYGGTKTEMERLMRDAEQMEGLIEGSLSIDNFADVVDAIHIVQENLGITGTTAKEASSTIQGSLATMAAAWQNVITGMGNGDADMEALIGELVASAETFAGNVMPVVEQALTGVATLISEMAPVIAEKLPALLQSILPMLLNSGVQIINTLAQGIIAAIPSLLPAITDVVVQVATMLVSMLPQIMELGAQVLLSLGTGISESLPELIPIAIDVILSITQYLLENIDLLVDCAGQLVIGLAVGIIQALPVLVEKVPILIASLVTAIIGLIPKLVEVGVKMVIAIKNAIVKTWPQIVNKAKELFTKFKTELLNFAIKFAEIGRNVVEGIKKGISEAWQGLVKWFTNLLNSLVDDVKKFFGIGSPSKLMAEQVGQWIPAGIAQGIQNGMKSLQNEMDLMSLNMLPAKVTAQSINTYAADATATSDPDTKILELLAQYLPVIAKGENVSIELSGDLGRLFRAMQREASRNTQLVGPEAGLAY